MLKITRTARPDAGLKNANAAKLAELREWFGYTLWEDHDQAELREDLIAIQYLLNKPHASQSPQKEG